MVCAPDGAQVQRAGAEVPLEAGAPRDTAVELARGLGRQVAEQLLAEDSGLLEHVVDV